jgi:AcrR family transcriptional regulator
MDPRIKRTHDAVMQAATELLLEAGPDALTVDAVVARSGVAKSTLYRHWATRDELVAAVFNHLAPALEAPDPALAFEPALRQLVRQVVTVMASDEWQRLLPALLLLKLHHDAIAELEESMRHRQDVVFHEVLERGVTEGVVPADVDLELSLTLLVGPILMAGLMGMTAVDDALADAVTDHFLSGLRHPG